MGDKILVDVGVSAIGARYYENFNPALRMKPFR